MTLTIENIENWGSKWIVFPNSVYGSAANFAAQYGYSKLFDAFDYVDKNSNIWDIYNLKVRADLCKKLPELRGVFSLKLFTKREKYGKINKINKKEIQDAAR